MSNEERIERIEAILIDLRRAVRLLGNLDSELVDLEHELHFAIAEHEEKRAA